MLVVHAHKMGVLDAAHPNPASMIKPLLNLPSTNMGKKKFVETNILELLPDTAFFQEKILLIPCKVHLLLSIVILGSAYRIISLLLLAHS